jgi:hypothetical protein
LEVFVVLITVVFGYLIDALLVGIALGMFSIRFEWNLSSRKIPLILFLVFGFLDLYALPALVALDATITVRNTAVAELMNLYPNYPFVELLGFGWYEIIIWLGQVLVALLVMNKIAQKVKREEGTSGLERT